MKIREIIEANTPAPSFGLKSLPVGSPDNAYQAGKDFGTKLLSPSQWFKGSSGGNNPDKEKKQDKETTTTKVAGSGGIRNSLEKAQYGTQLNGIDVENLKIVYNQLKNNKITSDNLETDMAAVKAAYDGNNLDQPQRDIVKNIINKY